jgi:hypothetical protein
MAATVEGFSSRLNDGGLLGSATALGRNQAQAEKSLESKNV